MQKIRKIIKRTALREIYSYLDDPEILVIIGPRQSGKTILLLEIQKYLIKKKRVAKENILFFNLDIITNLELFASQKKFINFIKERLSPKKRIFIMIDEVQRIENPGLFIKGIYDLNLPVKFILTGSSSLEIKSKTEESLTGRKLVFHLYPFSFYEYLKSKDKVLARLSLGQNISEFSQKQIMDYLSEYIIYGGYPRPSLEINKQRKLKFLKEIYSSYIEKDVVGFLKIKEPLVFTKLVSVLAGQIGQLINVKELSQTLKLNQRTIENYLNILEQTFVIKKITPFFSNLRKELTKMPKLYFIDSGLRNLAIDSFQSFDSRPDKGALLENYIFSSLFTQQKNFVVHFWRTQAKSEVDFVLKYHDGKIVPIEVKAREMIKPEISKSFRSFIKKYNPEKTFVVNLSYQDKMKIYKTEIEFILPFEIRNII